MLTNCNCRYRFFYYLIHLMYFCQQYLGVSCSCLIDIVSAWGIYSSKNLSLSTDIQRGMMNWVNILVMWNGKLSCCKQCLNPFDASGRIFSHERFSKSLSEIDVLMNSWLKTIILCNYYLFLQKFKVLCKYVYLLHIMVNCMCEK
jgi:hypothetical protein